jgi:flavin-binding protein dodecin
MSVAKVSEISATSAKSFEDALQQGLSRASKTLRNVRSAWVKEQHVRCENGRITEYQDATCGVGIDRAKARPKAEAARLMTTRLKQLAQGASW